MLALVGVTAIWGYTFVPVQEAIAVYPLFAFLAVRFAISTLVLAPFAWRSLRRAAARRARGRRRRRRAPRARATALQTAGLELTTVTSTGFITGLYVVLTPLIALVLFRTPVAAAAWVGVALAVAGLAAAERRAGRVGARQRARARERRRAVVPDRGMERFAPRYDARALTFLQMAVSCVGFTVDRARPRRARGAARWTVWCALLVTGVFAGALGYLVATWVQSRTTAARAALVFTLEAPFAALFGVLLLVGAARRRRLDGLRA